MYLGYQNIVWHVSHLKCLRGCIWCIYYWFLLLICNHIYTPLMCWSSCRSVLSRIQHSLVLRASCAKSGSPGCQWRFITAYCCVICWRMNPAYSSVSSYPYEYNDFNYLFYCFISFAAALSWNLIPLSNITIGSRCVNVNVRENRY